MDKRLRFKLENGLMTIKAMLYNNDLVNFLFYYDY